MIFAISLTIVVLIVHVYPFLLFINCSLLKSLKIEFIYLLKLYVTLQIFCMYIVSKNIHQL